MKALIIAAGAGSRLRDRGDIKPLVEIAGRPLIEHVGERIAAAGLGGIVVVTGYKAETLEAFLPVLSERIGLPVIAAGGIASVVASEGLRISSPAGS